MKRFGPIVLALALIICGCAQKKAPQASQESRLDTLETDFSRFQTEQRARDADIDHKLGAIATRLDQLAPSQTVAAKGRKFEPVPMAGGQPIVAGQVIPYSSLAGGKAAQPRPGQVQSLAPVAQAAPGPAQPLAPAPRAMPAQAQPTAPAPQAMAAGQQAPPTLNPPVVTLSEPAPVPLTAAARPRQPVPMERPRRAAGKASPTPKPLAAAVAEPAAPPPSAPEARTEYAPAIPSMGAPEAPAVPGAPAAPSAPAAPAAPAGVAEQQLYTEALRAVSSNHNEEGRKKFNDFMAKYPSSVKTPEALYWIGESYMGDKSYNQAILSFKEVTSRYPKDPKAADALYRIADAYERLGDKANAVFNLKLLLEQHPGSEFTGKARQKLKQLGQ